MELSVSLTQASAPLHRVPLTPGHALSLLIAPNDLTFVLRTLYPRRTVKTSAVGAAAAGARSLPASPRCEAQQLLFRTSEEDEKGAALAR